MVPSRIISLHRNERSKHLCALMPVDILLSIPEFLPSQVSHLFGFMRDVSFPKRSLLDQRRLKATCSSAPFTISSTYGQSLLTHTLRIRLDSELQIRPYGLCKCSRPLKMSSGPPNSDSIAISGLQEDAEETQRLNLN
jgi:hypothetical protein